MILFHFWKHSWFKKNRFRISLGWWILFFLASFVIWFHFFPYTILAMKESRRYLDRYETIIQEIPNEGIRHQSISYEEIPEFFRSSLMILEDRTFWNNPGLSLRGILRSIRSNIKSGALIEGGSTISQQLVRNIHGTTRKRSWWIKWVEALESIVMNLSLSKEEILTHYINRINFWYENYGLESASVFYFWKRAQTLSQSEQIALLTLIKNPTRYNPKTEPTAFRKRYELIIDTLEKASIIKKDEAITLKKDALIFAKSPKNLPHAIDYLESFKHKTSGNIKTTLDIPLSNRVQTLAESVLFEIGWKNVHDYGVYVIDRDTHEVRVMIGGRDYENTIDGQLNSVLAKRQVGSTLKPFLYLLAFKTFHLHKEDTILDLPVSYKTIDEYSYEPKNYSLSFRWAITYAEALAGSVNIPAVKILDRLSVKTFLEFLRSLGITSLEKNADHYGLSLALGTPEISLKELTDIYDLFSSNGNICTSRILLSDPVTCRYVIEDFYTTEITSILKSRANKMRNFPIGSALDFENTPVFVKTGTSRNFRDNWAIGFSEKYLIGVWTGNKNAENMYGVSWASGAGEIFSRIVRDLDPWKEENTEITASKNPTPFLAITTPLDWSVYEYSKSWITANFRTNIPYEYVKYIIDGTSLSGSFLPFTPGFHTLEINLFSWEKMLQKARTSYEVRATHN